MKIKCHFNRKISKKFHFVYFLLKIDINFLSLRQF